ncbi:acyl carrier protein [Streptomyces caniscabiei]|uniref:acyl carrier protein n=1 Tax=Streptomyces caniscabiei TaxID=2746961 RepID=UPI001CE18C9B|nr:acyl carrier protein [Streptomyces caniscabiei]MDX3510216.1 acyl carrier protein [Streptomyces caniscabiei]MDX3720979.1 acyl carrier protein [Streptomyces caniscabiei]WEO27828.1 acyl carrier protein [Streptomyces caniscabiei]
MRAETSPPPVTEAVMPAGAAPTVLTTGLVRELLSDRKIFPGVPDDLDEDAELVLDSLGLVWLLHVVEERYGLVVEPDDEDIAGLTSLRRLTEFLGTAGTPEAAGTADAAGTPGGPGAPGPSGAPDGGERGDR